MELAPIVLFVYNRPGHTEATLNALSKNKLADSSTLYIYCDGPKEDAADEELIKIREVKDIVSRQGWCKEVIIKESDCNKGLAKSIIDGVTEVVDKYGKVIVLEDDIETSPGFLKYMNDALTIYQNEDRIMGVSAFMYPIDHSKLPDTFLYNANSCWGWGTWKRAWRFYSNDALKLYLQLIEKKMDWDKFNGFQGNAFKDQLLANIEGTLNTWAVKWHASINLQDGSVLHPSRSLTRNIGFDGSGIHCGRNEKMLKMAISEEIPVAPHARLNGDLEVTKALIDYFMRPKRSLIYRTLLKVASRF